MITLHGRKLPLSLNYPHWTVENRQFIKWFIWYTHFRVLPKRGGLEDQPCTFVYKSALVMSLQATLDAKQKSLRKPRGR